MNAFLVCGLIFCLSPLTFSLKCYECGGEGGPCNNHANVKIIDCQAIMDRCMTVVMTGNVPGVGLVTQEMKNCSHSTMMCPDQSQGNACTQLASQPGITECKVTCCQGDLCNNVSPGADTPIVAPKATATATATATPTPTPTPTATQTPMATKSAVSVSVNTPLPTNTSSLSNTTSPGSTEPPSAGVPEFTATFGPIFLGFLLSSMAALG